MLTRRSLLGEEDTLRRSRCGKAATGSTGRPHPRPDAAGRILGATGSRLPEVRGLAVADPPAGRALRERRRRARTTGSRLRLLEAATRRVMELQRSTLASTVLDGERRQSPRPSRLRARRARRRGADVLHDTSSTHSGASRAARLLHDHRRGKGWGAQTSTLNGYATCSPQAVLFCGEIPREVWPDGADALRAECVRVLRAKQVVRCLPEEARTFAEGSTRRLQPSMPPCGRFLASHGPLRYKDNPAGFASATPSRTTPTRSRRSSRLRAPARSAGRVRVRARIRTRPAMPCGVAAPHHAQRQDARRRRGEGRTQPLGNTAGVTGHQALRRLSASGATVRGRARQGTYFSPGPKEEQCTRHTF